MSRIKDKLIVLTKWGMLLLVLITFAGCSNKKKVVVRNKQGSVEQEYYVDKDDPDKKIGLYMAYYPSGKPLETSTFNQDGKLDGERTLYFESGKIMVKEHYKNGVYTGPYQSYYENGGLESEGQFADNARTGLWKLYFDNPKNVLKQEVTFKDNMINGPSKEYFTNGKVFAEGNKIEISDGVDVYDGKVQVYDSLGTLLKVITYDKGRQTGKEEEKVVSSK